MAIPSWALLLLISFTIPLTFSDQNVFEELTGAGSRIEAPEESSPQPSIYCSCGKGIFSTPLLPGQPTDGVIKNVLQTCSDFYPKQEVTRDFSCSEKIPREFVCFLNNRFDDTFQLSLQKAPNNNVATKTAGFDWKTTPDKVQILGCLDGPINPSVHLSTLENLGKDIASRCETEIQTLCSNFKKNINTVVTCLHGSRQKFKDKDCFDALTLNTNPIK